MPWNGSGTFTRVHDWTEDKTAGIGPTASRFDADTDDIADGLENCVTRDGQNSPSANLPMGGNKHTGVGDASSRDEYAAVGQLQDGSFVFGTATGSGNNFTLTLSPAITAYAAGQQFAFKANHTISGAATLNVNGQGATAIKKQDGATALISGDIANGQIVEVRHDGTNFQMLSQLATASVFVDPMTTRGDIIKESAAGGPERLAIGAANTVLSTDGSDPAWTKITGAMCDTLEMTKPVEFAEGASVASAATADIWTPDDGNTVHITGTTTITSFGTAPQAGAWRLVIFDGALTLTNGASLILPGAANITTAAGDAALVYADSTTIMRVAFYTRADGTAPKQEAHPSATKVSGIATVSGGVPSLAASYNVSSITDTDTGKLSVSVETDFSSDAYAVIPSVEQTTGSAAWPFLTGSIAGSFGLENNNTSGGATDPSAWFFVANGDQ